MNWRGTVVRWLKFNAVGGIGIGVQLVVLTTLKSGLHLDYLLATGPGGRGRGDSQLFLA